MAYGMRTQSNNRAAVQAFRGRARQIWGISHNETPPSIFNDRGNGTDTEEGEDQEDEHMTQIAEISLAMLQAEADSMLNPKDEASIFLEKTEASLIKFLPPEVSSGLTG